MSDLAGEVKGFLAFRIISEIAVDDRYSCLCGHEPYTDGDSCPKCAAENFVLGIENPFEAPQHVLDALQEAVDAHSEEDDIPEIITPLAACVTDIPHLEARIELLEDDIASRLSELDKAGERIRWLEAENERLKSLLPKSPETPSE